MTLLAPLGSRKSWSVMAVWQPHATERAAEPLYLARAAGHRRRLSERQRRVSRFETVGSVAKAFGGEILDRVAMESPLVPEKDKAHDLPSQKS